MGASACRTGSPSDACAVRRSPGWETSDDAGDGKRSNGKAVALGAAGGGGKPLVAC
jgi:hypothetical protein